MGACVPNHGGRGLGAEPAQSTHTRLIATYATWQLGRALLGLGPGLVHLAQDFRVEAKGLEPSNLLTTSL